MKEVFDHAYEGFCYSMIAATEFTMRIFRCVCVVLIYLTIPLWFIPYVIYRKKKEGKLTNEDQT